MSRCVCWHCRRVRYAQLTPRSKTASLLAAGLPQKRPGRKLASAIRQYLLHEQGAHSFSTIAAVLA